MDDDDYKRKSKSRSRSQDRKKRAPSREKRRSRSRSVKSRSRSEGRRDKGNDRERERPARRSRTPPRRMRSPPRRRSPPRHRRSPSPRGRGGDRGRRGGGRRSASPRFERRRDFSEENKQVRGRKVFVGNLPWNINNKELKRLVEHIGDIEDVYIPKDKGFGFVTFDRHSGYRDAESCIRELHRSQYDGKALIVEFAQPRRF